MLTLSGTNYILLNSDIYSGKWPKPRWEATSQIYGAHHRCITNTVDTVLRSIHVYVPFFNFPPQGFNSYMYRAELEILARLFTVCPASPPQLLFNIFHGDHCEC